MKSSPKWFCETSSSASDSDHPALQSLAVVMASAQRGGCLWTPLAAAQLPISSGLTQRWAALASPSSCSPVPIVVTQVR